MPGTEQILNSLYTLANAHQGAARLWHVQILGAALAFRFSPTRPPMDLCGCLLTLPIASVSVLSAHGGSLFNGATFLLLTAMLGVCARFMPRQPVRRGRPVACGIGTVSLLVGIVYPHFVTVTLPVQYLLVAPVGVLPCPTLCVVVGATLLGDGFGSRWWSGSVAMFGIAYAAFGVFVLSVWLDLVLLVAAAWLLVAMVRTDKPSRPPVAAPAQRADTA